MYRVLLVDDDTISRVAINGMIDWQDIGFEIAGMASHGKMALELFGQGQYDIVITDMKMPIMDGVTLIKAIREIDQEVSIIALSSYNDFPLVREAFKCNIEDYLLKSELTPERLREFMVGIKEKKGQVLCHQKEIPEQQLEGYLLGKTKELTLELESYYVLVLQIYDYEQIYKRFIQESEPLTTRLIQVLEQIPKIANKSYFVSLTRAHLVIVLQSQTLKKSYLETLGTQIIQVIKDYLNIECLIGMSNWLSGGENLLGGIQEAIERMSLNFIYGTHNVFVEDVCEAMNLGIIKSHENIYTKVIESFKELQEVSLNKYQSEILYDANVLDCQDLKKRCLELIYYEAKMLDEMGISIWQVWGKRIDFIKKIEGLEERQRVIIWISNYNRFIMDYLKVNYDYNSNDSMDHAKFYIEDNYANADLSLLDVASVCHLNEKYFSTKFKKETGLSFKEYLTAKRIEAAENLLKRTDMKLAQISIAVGYHNVEHFIRVFKKQVGVSPREYGRHNR